MARGGESGPWYSPIGYGFRASSRIALPQIGRKRMRRLVFTGVALAVGFVTTAAFAVDDPILTRQKLMQANGGAFYGVTNGMTKGEIPFNPVVAASVIRTINAVAYSFGDYFPEGSDQGDTKASPKIWEEMAEFQEYLGDLQAASDAAQQAEPQTLEAFQTVMNDVGEACQQCHDEFRLSDD
jgi:cytochrome c556